MTVIHACSDPPTMHDWEGAAAGKQGEHYNLDLCIAAPVPCMIDPTYIPAWHAMMDRSTMRIDPDSAGVHYPT